MCARESNIECFSWQWFLAMVLQSQKVVCELTCETVMISNVWLSVFISRVDTYLPVLEV